MVCHTMIFSESDPANAGFTRHYFAVVQMSISGQPQGWRWQQIDAYQRDFGAQSQPFDGEYAAMADALATLGGDAWQ